MKRVIHAGGDGSPIEEYGSVGASAWPIADGTGEAHVYHVRIGPGGRIGPHPAGFGQLFVVLEGSGWVEGGSSERLDVGVGEAVFVERGEVHAKGSEAGMTALMIQVRDMELR